MIFVFSWDDGAPADVRLADLMNEYEVEGTFFIPKFNSEGRDVLKPREIRHIANFHEIAGHTRDHVYLSGLPYSFQSMQIREGNIYLEDLLGRAVNGFCYPGGRLDDVTLRVVKDLDLKYARSTVNFDDSFPCDRYLVPTTLQFYPHSRLTRLWNLFRFGDWSKRWRLGSKFIIDPTLVNLCRAFDVDKDAVFHVWGHSWEIEQLNLWSELEDIFRWVRDSGQSTMTVSSLIDYSYLLKAQVTLRG